MSQTIRLHIMITTLPGRGQEQVDAYTRLAPVVRAEEGCLQYDLHRVTGDPDRFVLVEHWASREALTVHDATPHMREADVTSPSFRAAPAQVIELESTPLA